MTDLKRLFSEPDASPVFITAEIGINHLGRVDLARRLIEAAGRAGVDAVKFQVFRTEKFYNKRLAPDAFGLFSRFELSFDDFLGLKEFAESAGLIFYATPLDTDSLDFLVSSGCPLVKVASSDITSEPFLAAIRDRVRKPRTPVILSTGFVSLDAIRRASRIFAGLPLALEYCVSKYPADPGDFDLNFIGTLRREFGRSGTVTGFSDHSQENLLSLSAVALGARLIERHFTTDRSQEGADHAMSLDPAMMSDLVRGIRELESALGPGIKRITVFESSAAGSSMRGLYASRDLRAGEQVRPEDLVLLRPGRGVTLKKYRSILNGKIGKDMGAYEEL